MPRRRLRRLALARLALTQYVGAGDEAVAAAIAALYGDGHVSPGDAAVQDARRVDSVWACRQRAGGYDPAVDA